MNTFITTGKHTQGCFVPVTCDDPSLTIIETNDGSKKWGILFFIGKPVAANCIGVINDETSFNHIHKSILTASVTKAGASVGSVWNRIERRRATI